MVYVCTHRKSFAAAAAQLLFIYTSGFDTSTVQVPSNPNRTTNYIAIFTLSFPNTQEKFSVQAVFVHEFSVIYSVQIFHSRLLLPGPGV